MVMYRFCSPYACKLLHAERSYGISPRFRHEYEYTKALKLIEEEQVLDLAEYLSKRDIHTVKKVRDSLHN